MRTLRFNQGFALKRERLSAIIRCIAEGNATSNDAIASYMGVNKPVAEGFRGWLCKTGLGSGTDGRYTLSPCGTIIANHDPYLQHTDTLWILHYFLISQHQERAEIWYRCFNEFLLPGKKFTSAELAQYVRTCIENTPSNMQGIEKDTASLVNCYTQVENLGNLGILAKGIKENISTTDVSPPDPLIIAFILFDSWQRRFGAVDSVRLSMLVDEPESIGRTFVADYTRVRHYIGQLERIGLVTFSDTQFEPVTRRFFDEPLTLISRYYQQ